MNERINKTAVWADYDEIINKSPGLLTYFAVEFPHAYAAIMRAIKPQEVVTIDDGAHKTVIDRAWLDTLQANDDEYAEEQCQQLLDDADSYDRDWW